MKRKIINTFLIVSAGAVLVALAFIVRVRATADTVAVLKTSGITCGSCVPGIEKALQLKKGVTSVEVDVDSGWVVVGYDSRKIKPKSIASTLSASGYPSGVAEVLGIERYKQITGQDIGVKSGSIGCGGGCCNK